MTFDPNNLMKIAFPRAWFSFSILILVTLLTGLIIIPVTAQTDPSKKFTIVIDPGHGGQDPGVSGKNSVEKDISLKIAMGLGHYITSLMGDADVFYTRETDVFVPQKERNQLALQKQPDLFISIHLSSDKDIQTTGSSAFILGPRKAKAVVEWVAKENKSLVLEPESMHDLSESNEFAAATLRQLRIRTKRNDLGINRGNFIVLQGCQSPGVLIMAGFLSNSADENFLSSLDGQDLIASAIYMAIQDYRLLPGRKIIPVVNQPISKSAAKKETVVAALVKDTTSEAEYRIQVLASKKRLPLNSGEFKGVKGLEEFEMNGYYKYMSRSVGTYTEALELKASMEARFKEPFIVRFTKGKKTS